MGKGKAPVTVYINEALRMMLDLYFKVNNNLNDDEYLFTNQSYCSSGFKRGNYISRQTAWKIVKDTIKAAGIDGKYGTHTLRKTPSMQIMTADSMAEQKHEVKNEAGLQAVQMFLNHRSVSSTFHYVGILERQLKAEVMRLNLGLEAIQNYIDKYRGTHEMYARGDHVRPRRRRQRSVKRESLALAIKVSKQKRQVQILIKWDINPPRLILVKSEILGGNIMGSIIFAVIIVALILKAIAGISTTVNVVQQGHEAFAKACKEGAENQRRLAKLYDCGYDPVFGMIDPMTYSDGSLRRDPMTDEPLEKGVLKRKNKNGQ